MKTPVNVIGDNDIDKVSVMDKVHELEDRRIKKQEQEAATVRILKLLLSHGAQPNQKDGSGGTALHDAARRGPVSGFSHVKFAHVNTCASPYSKRASRTTSIPPCSHLLPPLFTHVYGTPLPPVFTHVYGTPLCSHVCGVCAAQIQAVKILLQFKADSEMRNDSGQMPKYVAKQQKMAENEQLLSCWPQLIEPHNKAEFLAEWKYFLDDVDIPIVVPSASAQRVLDDLTIAEHQDTLKRWKRKGMPVIDEIVSGPLDVRLKATASMDDKKKKQMDEKKGRAIKTKAKNEDYARVQRFVNENKAKVEDPNLTDRDRRIMRANELIADKEANVASAKRLPKAFNTLEVPLDYYLTGKVGGGFIEKKSSSRQQKLSKEELVGVGAKKKKLEEEKKRLYRNTFSRERAKSCYDYLGVGRDHERAPNKSDNRHRSAAMQVSPHTHTDGP